MQPPCRRLLVADLPDGSSIKVGLVTDTGDVNDQAFNQSAWEGVQKAATDTAFEVKFIESKAAERL